MAAAFFWSLSQPALDSSQEMAMIVLKSTAC